MAGVKARCVHLCRVAGNTVIPYGKWHSVAVPWNTSVNGYTVPLPFYLYNVLHSYRPFLVWNGGGHHEYLLVYGVKMKSAFDACQHFSWTLCCAAKWHFLQQMCVEKWIGSGLLGTQRYNFQSPTQTLSSTMTDGEMTLLCMPIADPAVCSSVIGYHIIWICYGAPVHSSEVPNKVKYRLNNTTNRWYVIKCNVKIASF